MSSKPPSDRAAVRAAVRRAIENAADELIGPAKAVYAAPETGFNETATARLVAQALGRAGVPTSSGIAITGLKGAVSFNGSGPTVALLGELDAVRAPGHPAADPVTGAAHACGHHAQLGMLAGAAIGLRAPGVAEALSGSVAFMATPAEEFIEAPVRWELHKEGRLEFLSGKQEMIRLGAFDDVDMAMMIHTSPSSARDRFVVGGTSNAHVVHLVRFLGRAAHAGGAPHLGVNALQAAMLALSAINTQRETFQARDQTRVHGIITHGGDAANAVPAEVAYEGRVRGRDIEAVDTIAERVLRCYRAGALAGGGSVEIITIPGYMPLRNDPSLARLFSDNTRQAFGADSVIEQPPDSATGGSTDMGDLSQIMPVLHPYVAAAKGVGHGADYMVSNYRRAVVDSATALALTVVDLLSDGARHARAVLKKHRAAMTRDAYLRTQSGRLHEERYDAT